MIKYLFLFLLLFAGCATGREHGEQEKSNYCMKFLVGPRPDHAGYSQCMLYLRGLDHKND